MANTLGLQYYYFSADGKSDANSVQEDDFVVKMPVFETLVATFAAS